MSNRDRVLAYLRSISPADAGNADIVAATGVKPHQQVFMLTRELMRSGVIGGTKFGGEWRFHSAGVHAPSSESAHAQAATPRPDTVSPTTPYEFEKLAQAAMSKLYGLQFTPRRVDGVPKIFDLVSRDGSIVGDAKFYTLVQGERLPPAKFSVIAEHVWLLEKTGADTKFLVFGNDRRVPEQWLKRYGSLAGGVSFYFLDRDGELSLLNG
ncbi:MAG TPA: hypothetical protein VFO61_03345 [Alphaproteobacteria bacterium]|nr:hypothetical protein [Alphaproteobacteria bacterium]